MTPERRSSSCRLPFCSTGCWPTSDSTIAAGSLDGLPICPASAADDVTRSDAAGIDAMFRRGLKTLATALAALARGFDEAGNDLTEPAGC